MAGSNLLHKWSAVAMLLVAGCQASGAKTAMMASAPARGKPPRVAIETSLGDIIVELDVEHAPATSLNFIHYAESGYYDGTIFHRVLQNSMIHGGGYTSDMSEKPLNIEMTIADSWHNTLTNEKATIAMVRGREAGGAGGGEFFINVVTNANLDSSKVRGRFSVFGTVVGGYDVVERIRNVPVSVHPKYAEGRSRVVPVAPVHIYGVRLLSPIDRKRARATAALLQAPLEARIARLVSDHAKKARAKAVTTASGLHYVDLFVGPGPRPLITDTVQFEYRGTLLDGTEFETTVDKDSADRKVDSLIKGLQEGLMTMNEGGRRLLVVPPELAYGEGGIPGYIPSDATLVFELYLLAIK